MQICRGLAGQMGRNRRKGGRFQSSPKAALPPFVLFQQQPAANIFFAEIVSVEAQGEWGTYFANICKILLKEGSSSGVSPSSRLCIADEISDRRWGRQSGRPNPG